MKYISKPPTIDAFQWLQGKESEVIEELFGRGFFVRHVNQMLHVFDIRQALRGDSTIQVAYGDYIVIHSSGPIEVLSEIVFDRLYAPVLEDIPVPTVSDSQN